MLKSQQQSSGQLVLGEVLTAIVLLGGILLFLGPLRPGSSPQALTAALGRAVAPWAFRGLWVLLLFVVLRYGVLGAVRWLWLIPRMARERVAYAVLPPADFAPSAEAIAAFTADLLGMRRRVLSWLDLEATAFCVGLTTTLGGRPLMYWEFPRRFERELEGARSFYPGLELQPLAELLPAAPEGFRTIVRRLELRPGRPERFPLQTIPEEIDGLQAFAGVLGSISVDAGQRLEQRLYLLPVPPPLLTRVRRGLLGAARSQEFGDPLASVQSIGDRFNAAEAVERRIERQGLWSKLGRAEPMFRTQVLIRAQAGDRDAAGGLVKAIFGAWEQWAGQNYMRSVGWPVLGGLAIVFGSNSLWRRTWFDYRWREGICGQGRALTAWELWPLMKPWRKDQAGNAMRREGLDLAPPDNAPGRGKVLGLAS
jgi:hypothetical protein